MGRRGLLALAIVPLALAACGGSSATTTPTQAPGQSQGNVTTAPKPTGSQQQTVRWFVGLGSGTQPNQIADQSKFVANFNSTNPDIYLQMEIVPNANAYDTLQTEIAGGNAPDIIGPVGVRGRNGFSGKFLDLTSEIAKQKFDLTAYPDSLIKFFQEGAKGAQIGLPYLIYPGFLWYNQDLFAQQNVPVPPTKVGDQYNGKTWDWTALTDLAKKLTLDSASKHPGDAGFQIGKVTQWGVDFQWADGRRMASTWQAGSFVKDDGTTAQIPDAWKAAWKWYYDAMWKSGFAPTGKSINSTYLNNGATMSSGHIAMDITWGWAIGSLGSTDKKPAISKWNIAVIPSYNNQTSSPLDADTFTIWGTTKVPDAAFKAMVAIMADKQLQKNYGGLPAKTAEQQPYLTAWEADLKKIFPTNDPIKWEVFTEMIAHPANPSHEADMPNFLKVIDLYSKFYTALQNDASLDVDAALTKLTSDIQAAFNEAK